MRTLTISCGGGLAMLSSAHHNSPVCRKIWIRSVDARDVAEIPTDHVGDDCSDTESDESDIDPSADGGNQRSVQSHLHQPTTMTSRWSQRKVATSLSVSRSRLTTSPTVSSTEYVCGHSAYRARKLLRCASCSSCSTHIHTQCTFTNTHLRAHAHTQYTRSHVLLLLRS